MTTDATIARLQSALSKFPTLAVAVSGGVDSMTLAAIAHRTLGSRATMYHAVSPAVPAEATTRVRQHARAEGWHLTIINTGEFSDQNYLKNPVNRCFFCKLNLYGTIAAQTQATIASGANTSDLNEYRPGLKAADEYRVRHPYVECGIDKQTVRAIARGLDLLDLADLPAAPCLASRIETGIAIQASTLARVHQTEKLVTAHISPATVRCRMRPNAIVVELDETSLRRLQPDEADLLCLKIAKIFQGPSPAPSITFAPYRTGSAFVGETHESRRDQDRL